MRCCSNMLLLLLLMPSGRSPLSLSVAAPSFSIDFCSHRDKRVSGGDDGGCWERFIKLLFVPCLHHGKKHPREGEESSKKSFRSNYDFALFPFMGWWWGGKNISAQACQHHVCHTTCHIAPPHLEHTGALLCCKRTIQHRCIYVNQNVC